MSLYNGPVRGGNRGGKDQFNWDAVKGDKDREFYLGHSVKATTGRWQKEEAGGCTGKDVFWYTREKGEANDPIAAELRGVKEREEELMMEALGVKPKVKKLPVQPKLDTRELTQLTGKAEDEELDAAAQADRVKGLGYQPNQSDGHAAEHEVMAGTAGPVLERLPLPPAGKPPASAIVGHKRGHDANEKAQRKAERRAAKHAKKSAKKEKRAAKKGARKAAAREQDSASSDSPSDTDAAPNTDSMKVNTATGATEYSEPRHSRGSRRHDNPVPGQDNARARRQRRASPDHAQQTTDSGRWLDDNRLQHRRVLSSSSNRRRSVSPPRRRERSHSLARHRSEHRASPVHNRHDHPHDRHADHARQR